MSAVLRAGAAPVPVRQEHEFEAAYGLPELLPAGERLLWQGAPQWRVLAREALHVRKLALYFGVLLAWRVASAAADGSTLGPALASGAWLLPLALVAIGMALLTAWLIGRTSVYTITDRRVVMRIGIVLTVTFNLPFRQIDSAALHAGDDGSGDIALRLTGGTRIAYLHLWPHARPWRVKRTEPSLRALADAARVAALLGAALAEASGQARTAPSAGSDAVAADDLPAQGEPHAA